MGDNGDRLEAIVTVAKDCRSQLAYEFRIE